MTQSAKKKGHQLASDFASKWEKRNDVASDFALQVQSGKNATRWPHFFEVQKHHELASDLVVQFRLLGCVVGSTAFATGGPNPGRLCPPPRLGLTFEALGLGFWGLRFRGYIHGLGVGVQGLRTHGSRFGRGVCSVGCTFWDLRLGVLALSTSGLRV